MIFATSFLPGRDHEDVDPAEAGYRSLDDSGACVFGGRTNVHRLDACAHAAAVLRDGLEFSRLAGRQDKMGAGAGEHLGCKGAEGPRGAGDDGNLAADVEQRKRIGQPVAHGFAPGG